MCYARLYPKLGPGMGFRWWLYWPTDVALNTWVSGDDFNDPLRWLYWLIEVTLLTHWGGFTDPLRWLWMPEFYGVILLTHWGNLEWQALSTQRGTPNKCRILHGNRFGGMWTQGERRGIDVLKLVGDNVARRSWLVTIMCAQSLQPQVLVCCR